MIQNINVNKIHHHPDNPRKDLGDLTELADSIKQNGILQNLTLVPWFSTITRVGADDPKQQEELGYYAVIGNRRLAAAKLAGLTEVPAVIRTDMDHKTQVATMLLENMQRNDLTLYEQAQGFQMMLNLGESVTNICEKTGLSESTVRRRVKLMELDQEKLKESASRGATLQDYMELEKVEDRELRNKVLEKIGTTEFNWQLRNALDKEKKEKEFAKIIEKLNEFAERLESHDGKILYVRNYYKVNDIEVPEDIDTVKYFYIINFHNITLYRKADESEKVEQRRLEEEKRMIKRTALEDVSKRAYESRYDFIKSVTNANAKKNIKIITQSAIAAMVEHGYKKSINYEDVADILNIAHQVEDEENLDIKDIADELMKLPELSLLVTTYISMDSQRENYYNWTLEYKNNQELNQIYELLEQLGYQMSDEEIALQNGTHELFGN